MKESIQRASSFLQTQKSEPSIAGDLDLHGNINPLRSLTEPLQEAKDDGAKRALIPIENNRNFPRRRGRHHGAGRPNPFGGVATKVLGG